jgi:large subunit ribosomal protein L25
MLDRFLAYYTEVISHCISLHLNWLFKTSIHTGCAYGCNCLGNGTDKINAILQDIQFHPVTDRILHIDFYQIFENKEITMEIPVKTVGVSKGVLNGGTLRQPYRKLRVKAIPSKLPDFIEVDITPLKIGSKVYLVDLKNDDYKLLHPDNTVVCQVRRSRLAIVDVEDEEEEDEEGAAAEGDDAEAETAAEQAQE